MEKRNRDKCEVTVHAGGTRGVAPLVLSSRHYKEATGSFTLRPL